MKRQKKRQQGVYGKEERLFDGMIYIVLFLVLALMVYPLIYVVSCSFSDPLLVLRGEIRLLPRGFHLDSYAAWRGRSSISCSPLRGRMPYPART